MSKSIIGILLAAGQASRFGSDKLLHPLDGVPMAVTAARNLLDACDRVVAVVRPDSQPLATLLAANGCEITVCHNAKHGMAHSLTAGIKAALTAHGWLVALADMPFITPDSHRTVAHALRCGASLAASEYAGRRGHPVGFAQHWRETLLNLQGDHGGKSILQAHPDELCLCPVSDPGVVRDIDRLADL